MAASINEAEDFVSKVFQHIEKHDPESHHRLNDNDSQNFKKKLSEKIKNIGNPHTQVDHPSERRDAIKEGLKMSTYKVIIKETQAARREAQLVYPTGTPFKTMPLNTEAETKKGYYMQLASIVIEGISLVSTVAGICVKIREALVGSAAEELARGLQESSEVETVVAEFLKAWEGGADLLTKAKALYNLLTEIHTLCTGIIYNVVKLLFSEMDEEAMIETVVLTIAQLLASFGTGGAALIGHIILALGSAVEFSRKIKNLREFSPKSSVSEEVEQEHETNNDSSIFQYCTLV